MRGRFGGPGIEEPDHRHRRLLRARRKRPCNWCAAKQRDEFAPSNLDLDCHVTLPRGSAHAMEELYHASIARSGKSRACSRRRLWVKVDHSAMSARCPVCPKADTAGRFMRTRPNPPLVPTL